MPLATSYGERFKNGLSSVGFPEHDLRQLRPFLICSPPRNTHSELGRDRPAMSGSFGRRERGARSENVRC
jgi:hypothetical protein